MNSRDTAPLLSVENLVTSFRVDDGWREVVKDVSFDIARGETLALVGESGSGKSVTALSIMRLLSTRKARMTGRISFEGRDLLGLSETAMRDMRGGSIGMIFQEPMTSLNPVMTIGEQIAETLKRHRHMSAAQAAAETLRLLERVRIPAAAKRARSYPHHLSGGMRQRVMIAMALAASPRLLVADEPTTALDVTVQAEILNLIKQLQEEDHLSVLFITHDMGVVAEVADRILVMLQGRAVESGETARIFSAPQHPYTRLLLSAVPKLGSGRGTTGPTRFPVIDIDTGLPEPASGQPASVAGERPVLEVSNLTTRFSVRGRLFERPGRVHAVENVSFSLNEGETLAIVGESGCGKSTTGRSVMRLVEPTSGSIRLDGEEMLSLSAGRMRTMRRRIQMIFQDPYASLDPRMTVGSAIAEPLVALGINSSAEAGDIVASLLRQVGLTPAMAGRYPHEFSGGQRQRICIARALALQPRVIVADECVSALDASTKAQIANLMMDLQASLRIAYIFISHDMAVVERISHRVAVMYRGEIVEIGPSADIFADPQHPYTRKLLAAVPSADPANRHRRRGISSEEIANPIFPLDYIPPTREYRKVSQGHFVQVQ